MVYQVGNQSWTFLKYTELILRHMEGVKIAPEIYI